MSVLALAPDFHTGDGFLHALLGLVAAAAAVRALAPSTSPPAHAAADDRGDPVLDAILGVIHLTSLATQVTSSWATAAGGVAPASERAYASTPIDGLLR